MTPLAISKIRSNYATLARDRDGLAADLSARLRALSAVSKPPFGAGARNEGAAVVALLDRMVGSLDGLGAPARDREALRPCHEGQDWQTSDYIAIGEALLDTIQARLASEFDEEARAAWAAAFVLAADMGMQPSPEAEAGC